MISDRIEVFLADKGYDADAIREEISSANIEAVIPSKSNRRDPIPHDKTKYKWRNQIERLFNKLKNWRRVATQGSGVGAFPRWIDHQDPHALRHAGSSFAVSDHARPSQ